MSVDTDGLDLVVSDESAPNRIDEAGVERAVMQRLDVAPGEFIAVEGRASTVASVARASVEADGVALGEAVRTNADVDPGDRVTVSKATVEPADQVTVAPTRAVDIRDGDIPLARAMAGRPVSAGDAVDATLLNGSLSLTFVVTDTVPQGPVLITEQTTVIARSGPSETPDERPVAFDDVGGMTNALGALRDAVLLPLEHPERFEKFGEDPAGGVLLTGPSGGGKTLLANALATELDAHVIRIDTSDVSGMRSPAVNEEFQRVAREARAKAPALVVVDELDTIAPETDRATDRTRRIASHFRSLVDALDDVPSVALLTTAQDAANVDQSLRRGGRLEREIELTVPDREERRDILSVRTRDVPLASDVNLDSIADRTHGFVGADLGALVTEAVLEAARRDDDSTVVTSQDVEYALESVEPSALRNLQVDVPSVTYDDIGGLDRPKRELSRVVEWPMRYPQLFEYLNATPPGGILLYGPPGTGKTMLAKAVANATDANFISVKGPEVLDKWVGESERAIRELFETARQNAPSVIFFDEVDSISPQRGNEVGTQAVERVVSQLLTEMDGLEPLDDVVVIAATNRPDVIDPALLRPGRFEQFVEVGMPGPEARREIFAVHTREVPTDDVDLDVLAEETSGYTGSDIAAVVREASLLAIEEYLDGNQISQPQVTADHFARAMASVEPAANRGTLTDE